MSNERFSHQSASNGGIVYSARMDWSRGGTFGFYCRACINGPKVLDKLYFSPKFSFAHVKEHIPTATRRFPTILDHLDQPEDESGDLDKLRVLI